MATACHYQKSLNNNNMAGTTDITKDLQKRIEPQLEDGLLLINAETKAVQEVKIDDIRSLLAVFLSGGIIPRNIAAGTNLGTPAQPQIYYAPAGSYTTPTGVVNLTGNLNMWFWNKISWAYLEIPVSVDMAPFAKNDQINTFKGLYYSKGNTAINFDKVAYTVTTNGFLYIFNGSYTSGSARFIRIDAGVINMATAVTAFPADNYFYIYCKPPMDWINGTGGNYIVSAASLIIKSYNDPTIVDARSNNMVLLFTFNKASGKLHTPFLNEDLFEVLAGGSALPVKKKVNAVKAFNFSMGSSTIAFDKATTVISSSSTMYVFNGSFTTSAKFIQVNSGSLSLAAAIAASPGEDFFYCYVKAGDAFISGEATANVVIAFADILIKSYNSSTISDVLSNDAIVLFTYNKRSNTIASPFLGERILETIAAAANPPVQPPQETVKTHLKLHFTHRGDFTWNDVTKVLTWSGNLYVFNRYKNGALSANYLRIEVGSFDFKTYADTVPSEFLVAYLKLTSGSALNFVNGTGVGVVPVAISDIYYKGWDDAGVSEARDQTSIVLFHYNKNTGRVSSPFLIEDNQTNFLKNSSGAVSTANVPWFNRYPEVYKKLSGFIGRYTAAGNGSNKNRIVMLGDSLFARHQHTSALDIDPKSSPPTLITKNFGAYLWQNLKGNRPVYNRFDYAGRFTETGTWSDVVDLGTWDDATDISNITRSSSDTAAAFAFTVAAAISYFNLVYRKDSLGHTNVVVSVSSGNGTLQAKLEGDTVWSEANGFVFSQRHPAANAALGIGNTQYQTRLEFRKVSTGLGSAQTVTISKATATSDTLMYWGVEEIKGNKPYVQLLNVARGGHTLADLKFYVQSDVFDRKPSLVVLELPLLNMVAADSTVAYMVNQVHDFVWGDRAGNINALSLKAKSNNWADFEVLLIVPHHGRSHFNADSTFADQSSGYTAEELYNAVKGLIYSKGDVSFVDMSTALNAEIKADPLFGGNYYAAMGSSGVTGSGYFNDSLHQNDKGTLVWAKHICPVFMMSSF